MGRRGRWKKGGMQKVGREGRNSASHSQEGRAGGVGRSDTKGGCGILWLKSVTLTFDLASFCRNRSKRASRFASFFIFISFIFSWPLRTCSVLMLTSLPCRSAVPCRPLF